MGDELTFALGQGIPGWVAWHGKPMLVADAQARAEASGREIIDGSARDYFAQQRAT